MRRLDQSGMLLGILQAEQTIYRADLERAYAAFIAAGDDDEDELLRLALNIKAASQRVSAPTN
jgi:hypothetical protein